MLPVLVTNRVLRFTSAGRLQTWMGPALRGTIGSTWKRQVCVYPPVVQEKERRHCRGCPHMAGCPYGETIESEPGHGPHFTGQEDGVRAIAIAPDFPAPPLVEPGMSLNVGVLFTGTQAVQHADAFWRSARTVGMDRQCGLGPDRVGFDVLTGPEPAQLRTMELTQAPGAAERPVRVAVELTSPLFLRQRDEGSGERRVILEPSCSDLIRAGLRVLGGLSAAYDEALQADFAGLKSAAHHARTLHAQFKVFRQWKHSNRAGTGGTIVGIVGRGVYDGVQPALIPWLRWAGEMGVGPFRSAGAGRWLVDVQST